MGPRKVVTSFLQHQGKVLLLQRSDKVRTFQGLWAGVSGSIPDGVAPLHQALQEISEETGLVGEQVELGRSGDPLLISDEEGREWLVHSFLFYVEDISNLTLDWEHSRLAWVTPSEIDSFATVPGLKETWEQLWKK